MGVKMRKLTKEHRKWLRKFERGELRQIEENELTDKEKADREQLVEIYGEDRDRLLPFRKGDGTIRWVVIG